MIVCWHTVRVTILSNFSVMISSSSISSVAVAVAGAKPRAKRVAKPKVERGKLVRGTSIGTFTFSECVENHAGMQQVGTCGEAGSGFTVAELTAIRDRCVASGVTVELVSLGGEGRPEAAVLVIRGGVNALLGQADGAELLFAEHGALEHDTKALMRGRVVEKWARGNLCYADTAQEPDYAAGKGRIVAYESIPWTQRLRNAMPDWFGEKARDLKAEGNYYYDLEKCGIGFHGDGERRKVVAARVGASMPIHYQWFHRFKPVGERFVIPLHDGDMYIMSEKAAGTDWKSSSILTLRHATGGPEYTTIKEKKPKAPKATVVTVPMGGGGAL